MTNHVFTDSEITEILNLINSTRHTQYIGARYVPIFGRINDTSIEWDNSAPYEPLTIVIHQGNSYTSRQYVPTGIDIANAEYWAPTGNFNAQVESIKTTANHALTLAQTNEHDISLNDIDIADIRNKIIIKVNTFNDLISISEKNGIVWIRDINAYYNLSNIDSKLSITLSNGTFANLIYKDTININALLYNRSINDVINIINTNEQNKRCTLNNGIYETEKSINFINGNYPYFNGTIKANTAMDYVIGINQDLTTTPTLNNGELIRKKILINIDCNNRDDVKIGFTTTGLYRNTITANIEHVGSSCAGIQTKRGNGDYAENVWNINVNNLNVNNLQSIGVNITGSDDIFDIITTINTHIGVKITDAGSNYINVLHPWLSDAQMYPDSIALSTINNTYINYLYADTYQTCINTNNIATNDLYINTLEDYTNNSVITTPNNHVIFINSNKGNIIINKLQTNIARPIESNIFDNKNITINALDNPLYNGDLAQAPAGTWVIPGNQATKLANAPKDFPANAWAILTVHNVLGLHTYDLVQTTDESAKAWRGLQSAAAPYITWKANN